MTRPVSNQPFKELTVLCSKSGEMLVSVRYLRLAGSMCTMISAFFVVSCLHTSYFILQVVLVTDGSLGIGKGSLRNSLQTLKQRGDDKKFPLPFPFPTKLYIMCVANAEEVTSLLIAYIVNDRNVPPTSRSIFISPLFCTPYFNSYIRMFISVSGNSKCDVHSFLYVVAVTDEWHHEQLGGAPPSQRRRRTNLYCRWGSLHEERTGNVWVWLWDNLIIEPCFCDIYIF